MNRLLDVQYRARDVAEHTRMVLAAVPGSGAPLVRKLAELADAASMAAEAYGEELRRLNTRLSMLEARLNKLEKNSAPESERYSQHRARAWRRDWAGPGDGGTKETD
jgi:hypothetical protein